MNMQEFITTLAEYIADNDEAIDAYGRAPRALDYSNGFEYVAPAWLSYYSSTGTGTPWQDRLIERLEQAQADEWARQYPERAPLFDVASEDESPLQNEAQEWLDAALEGECIYLSLEIEQDDLGDYIIRAGFTDEINRPLATQFERTLESLPDDAEALIVEIADTIYKGADND